MRRPQILRARPEDREIWRLALPAFGALVAEPLYVLVDTAIVGHLGTRPLGGLAVAGTVLTGVFGIFNFLAFATTAAVARRTGAGLEREAAEHGVAGCWLAAGLGLGLLVLGQALAAPVVDALGASDSVRPYALTYLRIGLIGAPFMLLSLAGVGYLRGRHDTRTPLVIAIAANVANLALELLFVYGLDLGIAGSAWGTVLAQTGAGVAYLLVIGRNVRTAHASARPAAGKIRATAVVGSHLVVRTGALLAAFTVTTAIAARLGDVEVAAHQIAFQVWWFLALAIDAVAIAAQAIVGRALGAGDPDHTRASARRMMEWSVVVGLGAAVLVLATQPALTAVFSDDDAVRDQLLEVLWAVALMQPFAAIVFTLDGILIGAGESRYLAIAMVGATVAFLPVAFAVLVLDAGLLALWGALYVFILGRLYGMWRRYRTDRWIVLGARRR